GVVRAIPAPGAAVQPRSWFDRLVDWARSDLSAAGLGYIVFDRAQLPELEATGPIAKFVHVDPLAQMAKKAGLRSGDVLFFSAGRASEAARVAGAVRTRLGQELGLIASDRFDLCWVVDFPMYEWNEEEKKIDFSHNPFSMPNMDAEEFLTLDPAD